MATEIQQTEQLPVLTKDARDWVQPWKATGNLKEEILVATEPQGARP